MSPSGSPSLYGFVRDHGPVSPEEVAINLLSLPEANGDARMMVERLVGDDSRFWWDSIGRLRTVDPASLHLADASYVVFDVETTGSSARQGAITELGALKVEGGMVVDEMSTLLNPGRPIEPFVVRLTGITNQMVADAPPASEVMPAFERFVEGAVLVGHNVHFDCSFVAAARGGEPLPNPVLDTLKLARVLVPGLKRYKLSALAAHFGVRQTPNHRALSDAAATAEVFLKLLKLLGSAGVGSVGEAAMLKASGRKIKPQKQHLADGVPTTPGVYYFLDKGGNTLYVGKAKNLKVRVRTYFNGGDGRRKVGRLVEEVAEVRCRETGAELDALILEAREIKRLLPRYNSAGREPRASWYVKLDVTMPYPLPERTPAADPADGAVYLGPYRSAGVLDVCIEALGRIFPLPRCSGDAGPCFYGQMGRCAPCMGLGAEEYRERVVDEIVALLRGEGGEEHLAALARERDRLARELEFEAAARLRDLISGIERVRLTRMLASADGVQAVVAPSTEPGLVEVFVLLSGRLVAHRSFAPADADGLSRFAGDFAEGISPATSGASPRGSADEARVVAAYLRRRSAAVEAVRLRRAEDLLEAVGRVVGGSKRDVGKPA